jgi:ribosomal protein L11 methyltransferase
MARLKKIKNIIMDYFELNIEITPYSETIAEILIAELSEIGFESFVDTSTGFQAYVAEKTFDEESLSAVLAKIIFEKYQIRLNKKLIPAQNWNAVWEHNFEPIFIQDKIAVVAPFHHISQQFEYQITIEPKMSFGTGHHETTSLMMEQMLLVDFTESTVLDMGCGTGILGILAAKMGAKDITAIDFDEWAYNNAIENFERNNCNSILTLLGDATIIPQKKYSIILANINRNVLLSDISNYAQVLDKNGLLLLSGFYSEDIPLIEQEANKSGLDLQIKNFKNNWSVCVFKKH